MVVLDYLRRHWLVGCLFLLLLGTGVAVRTVGFGDVPGGLNQDEASMGYDAYSLLKWGVDRNGMHHPVHMVAWGSGQNALLAYLTMPVLAIWGLEVWTIRLVPLLLGILALPLFFWTARRMGGTLAGLAAMGLLAICPWHVVLSRWALESNLLPVVLLAAVAALMKAQDERDGRWLAMSMGLFAMSLYAYSTAFAFVPIFLGLYALYAWKKKVYSSRQALVAASVLAILSAPIFLFFLVNHFHWGTINLGFLTIPHMPGQVRYSQMSSMFGQEFWKQTLDNWKRVADILLLEGNDGETQSSVRGVASLYALSVPLFFIGLGAFLRDWWREKGASLRTVWLLWLLVSLTVSGLATPAVHRINHIYFPLLLVSAMGWVALWNMRRFLGIAAVGVYIVFFGRFVSLYFGPYAQEVGDFFFASYTEAVDDAVRYSDPADTLYLSDYLNQPYIHVLFTTRHDVRDYLATRTIPDTTASFQQVRTFGRYVFGLERYAPPDARVMVAQNGELSRYDLSRWLVRSYRNFSVLYARDFYEDGPQGTPVRMHRGFSFERVRGLVMDGDTLEIVLPDKALDSMTLRAQSFYGSDSWVDVPFHTGDGVWRVAVSRLPAGPLRLEAGGVAPERGRRALAKLLFHETTRYRLLRGDWQGSQEFGSWIADRAFGDVPLDVGQGVMPWGYGTHADSRFGLDLPQNADSLYVGMGLSRLSGDCGDGVVFAIGADGRELVSVDVPRGELRKISVSLAGARRLEWSVARKKNPHCDHANWMAPMLVLR